MEDSIARLAASQHGLLTRQQALSRGMTRNAWSWLTKKGGWVTVHPGVIRQTTAPQTWEQSLLAGCLAVDGIASHRAAAVLWGIPDIKPVLEITLPQSRRVAHPKGFRVHLTRQLEPKDRDRCKGIPVTSLARTVIDLCLAMPDQAPAILNHVLAKKRVTLRLLLWLLRRRRTRGRKGAAELEELLVERQGRNRHADSEFQRLLEEVVTAASKAGKLPPVVFEHPVQLPDGRWRFLDAAFPGTGHGLEADSYEHHSNQEDWERDHTRNLELLEVGWIAIPITRRMLKKDPDGVVKRIAGILIKAGVWAPAAAS